VAKELVCPIDEVDLHPGTVSGYRSWRGPEGMVRRWLTP
jgi:hypothetical protein